MDLHHITTFEKARRIIEEGFQPGLPSEAGISPSEEEELEDMGLDVNFSSEFWAREALNELLPSHSSSTFFWADESKANGLKHDMAIKANEKFVNIVVDSSKIPCQCKTGPFQIAEHLFSMLEQSPNLIDFYDEEELESFGLLDEWKEMNDLVEKYKDDLRDLTEQDKDNWEREVMCDCQIPPEAIIRVDNMDAKKFRDIFAHTQAVQHQLNEFEDRPASLYSPPEIQEDPEWPWLVPSQPLRIGDSIADFDAPSGTPHGTIKEILPEGYLVEFSYQDVEPQDPVVTNRWVIPRDANIRILGGHQNDETEGRCFG